MNPAFQILAELAWAKVNLEALQKQSADAGIISAAISKYRQVLRRKKALDAGYREHHAAMAEAEYQGQQSQQPDLI